MTGRSSPSLTMLSSSFEPSEVTTLLQPRIMPITTPAGVTLRSP
jgi:hypothetical protein